MQRRDLASAARLATQLGYPTSESEIAARFDRLSRSADDCVYVAEAESGRVAGWMHLRVYSTLESEPQAWILGLVVDEALRRQGIGRALLAEAERWAASRGVSAIRLQSNVVRREAHAFYEALGFRILKTQHAFEKRLADGSRSTQNRL